MSAPAAVGDRVIVHDTYKGVVTAVAKEAERIYVQTSPAIVRRARFHEVRRIG